MLVIRGANEVTIWRIRRPTAKFPGQLVCLNDQFAVPPFTEAPAATVAALKAMVAHAVQLGGAVQQVIDISELP